MSQGILSQVPRQRMIFEAPCPLLHDAFGEAHIVQSGRANLDAAGRQDFSIPVLWVSDDLVRQEVTALRGPM